MFWSEQVIGSVLDREEAWVGGIRRVLIQLAASRFSSTIISKGCEETKDCNNVLRKASPEEAREDVRIVVGFA